MTKAQFSRVLRRPWQPPYPSQLFFVLRRARYVLLAIAAAALLLQLALIIAAQHGGLF